MTAIARLPARGSPLFRRPRGALRAMVAGLAILAGTAAQAQVGDAVAGRLLYEDTPNSASSPQAGQLQACLACHFSLGQGLDPVTDRRRRLGNNDSFPALSESFVRQRIVQAIDGERDMRQFDGRLTADEIDDLAAYIADTPKLLDENFEVPVQLEFDAESAGATAFRTIRIKHSVATQALLVFNSATVNVLNAGFVVNNGTCHDHVPGAPPLAVGAECTFTVGYTPTDATRRNAVLTVSLAQQGVPITRTVKLTGGIEGQTPPAPAPLNPNGGGGGGGALGWAWLAALACAAAAAGRCRGA